MGTEGDLLFDVLPTPSAVYMHDSMIHNNVGEKNKALRE